MTQTPNKRIEGYEMTASARKKVYVQRHWTVQALAADGFHTYAPIKRITMARRLPAEEAPKIIETAGETLTAEAGYWIAYVAGKVLKETLDEYRLRPIDPRVFTRTYRPWDEPEAKLSATQMHLLRSGCQPYYKFTSVRAKHLTADAWIKSMESDEPVLAPAGTWLCIGTTGKPWSVTDAWFQKRYVIRP